MSAGETLRIPDPLAAHFQTGGVEPMGDFYCPDCADQLGLRKDWWSNVDPLSSEYQKKKHEKHTSASTSYEFQSVFDDDDLGYYEECVREALQRGAIEETSRGTNAVYCPSTQSDIGSAYHRTSLIDRRDTVVVVKSTESRRLHGMVESASKYSDRICTNCGKKSVVSSVV